MADAEYFALQAAEASAERHIKVVQHHFAKLLCRVAGRCEESGNRMAVFLRIKGDCFQTPNLGSTPRRLSKIGRASCRERVQISVVDVAVRKKSRGKQMQRSLLP